MNRTLLEAIAGYVWNAINAFIHYFSLKKNYLFIFFFFKEKSIYFSLKKNDFSLKKIDFSLWIGREKTKKKRSFIGVYARERGGIVRLREKITKGGERRSDIGAERKRIGSVRERDREVELGWVVRASVRKVSCMKMLFS